MPESPKKKQKFFVFIIESPAINERERGVNEGGIIKHAAELNGIRCFLETISSLREFEDCLFKLNDAMNDHPNCMPILHISAHGSDKGITLSDINDKASDARISWDELREMLRPVNEASNNESLILCMSSCNGYRAVDMAMHPNKNQNLPYFALIGTDEEPSWVKTRAAYTTLYHQLNLGKHIDPAVRAMSEASGCKFWVKNSEKTRQEYIDLINSPNLVDLISAEFDRNAQELMWQPSRP
ncbi:MAG: hypothetical protein PHD39_04505 [Methylobacter tundripaludum]|nr:hypothetical protein [Methylobacter tundripaludum]